MSISILSPGPSTTVQDLGRFGNTVWGLAHSGAMDRRAATIANILVDNQENAALLEYTKLGPTIRFNQNAVFAITGARSQATLDGEPVQGYRAVRARAGQTLSIGYCQQGLYGYIAFAGGVDVPLVLGSASTHLAAHIGGFNGRALAEGDELELKGEVSDIPNLYGHFMERDNYYNFGTPGVTFIRVVPGPHEHLFDAAGVQAFYNKVFVSTGKSDRTSYYLNGQGIATKADTSDVLSDGVAFGSIQVPSRGRPIIAMADRHTTSGVTKIGTVASVDLPLLVQRQPNDLIRFRRISVYEAQDLLRQQRAFMDKLRRGMRRPYLGEEATREPARRIAELLAEQPVPKEGKSKMLASMFRNVDWAQATQGDLFRH